MNTENKQTITSRFSTDGSQSGIKSSEGGSNERSDASVQPIEPGVKIPKQDEYNPWDLDAARTRQKKDRRVKVVTAYRIAPKPREGAFFRINPDPNYHIDTLLYIEKGESGIAEGVYFGDWMFADEIEASEWAVFFRPASLYLAIELHSTKPYVHYIKQPREGQKDNDWWESARTIAERAMKEWVQPYNAGGNFDYHPASRQHSEPIWPETSFGEILQTAFKGKFIDSWDHEVMKALRGA